MELSHYSQWKLDIKNLVQNKAWLLKNYHLQPSEVDRMAVWEWLEFIDAINELNKQEKYEREKEEKKYNQKFKTPKMPTPSIPKIKY